MKNPKVLVCTTFANRHWAAHAKAMVESFDAYWPAEVGLVAVLDDGTLAPQILPIISKRGGAVGTFDKDGPYQAFKAKHEKNDHPTDYRHQFFRFSHKIFALNDAMTAAKDNGFEYVIWLDADTVTTKKVSWFTLKSWLPKGIVSYLGRKDWHHSECGFMAYEVTRGTPFIRAFLERFYLKEEALKSKEQHDSWLFDALRLEYGVEGEPKASFKDLTEGQPGMDIWAVSPLAPYMTHFKGPQAKMALENKMAPVESVMPPSSPPPIFKDQPLNVQVKNCVDHEIIRNNVSKNLAVLDRWVEPCAESDEEVVFVSGGPSLDVKRVKWYAGRGYRIVCVKHALERLLAAGVVPWACVLLDPRVHVENFVANPDKRVRWLVASMVDPKVLHRLLENGCKVWGYHAAVGAGEDQYVGKGQPYIAFGSASSTRGLFVLNVLGFRKFVLLGYDLCHWNKPDLNQVGADGNKKYLEINLGALTWGGGKAERTFWTEGQLLAQAQEVEQIVEGKLLEVRTEGDGMVPFMLLHKGRYKEWWKACYKPYLPKWRSADAHMGRDGWLTRKLQACLWRM